MKRAVVEISSDFQGPQNPIIRQSLANHRDRLKKLHVSSLSLFGSAARGEAEVNDLDFLVEFNEPPGLVSFMELKFFLEDCFQLPVDLHTANTCPKRFYQRIEDEIKHVA
ncbi:MAG: nucleotidyltransferase family protein [Opitutales bacterium]